MTLVVSDTSPIRALHFLKLMHLLNVLFERVVVPPAVANELQHPNKWHPPIILSDFPFIEIRTPTNKAMIESFRIEIDLAESEAIVLALELNRCVILIDEANGRAVADRVGLTYTGVLGVLLVAKERGEITFVRPLIDQLQNGLGFFIAPALRKDVLRDAHENE